MIVFLQAPTSAFGRAYDTLRPSPENFEHDEGRETIFNHFSSATEKLAVFSPECKNNRPERIDK